MIKLELTEDEVRRVLAALRNQELCIEDELRHFKRMSEGIPVLELPDHYKDLQQISQECYDVAEKIRVQWRGTW